MRNKLHFLQLRALVRFDDIHQNCPWAELCVLVVCGQTRKTHSGKTQNPQLFGVLSLLGKKSRLDCQNCQWTELCIIAASGRTRKTHMDKTHNLKIFCPKSQKSRLDKSALSRAFGQPRKTHLDKTQDLKVFCPSADKQQDGQNCEYCIVLSTRSAVSKKLGKTFGFKKTASLHMPIHL